MPLLDNTMLAEFLTTLVDPSGMEELYVYPGLPTNPQRWYVIVAGYRRAVVDVGLEFLSHRAGDRSLEPRPTTRQGWCHFGCDRN